MFENFALFVGSIIKTGNSSPRFIYIAGAYALGKKKSFSRVFSLRHKLNIERNWPLWGVGKNLIAALY